MEFLRQQADPGRNVVGVSVVVLFHVALVYVLMSGLGRKVIEVVKAPIETKVIEETTKPPPPPPVELPPPPKLEAPPPPFIPPPEVQVQAPPPAPTIVAVQTPPPASTLMAPPAPPAPAPVAPPAPAAPSVGVSCPGYQQVLIAAGFPREAQRAQLGTGEVTISFTIGTGGEVKDAAVIKSTNRTFNRHSLETVARFKCAGQAQEVAGVVVKLEYRVQ